MGWLLGPDGRQVTHEKNSGENEEVKSGPLTGRKGE